MISLKLARMFNYDKILFAALVLSPPAMAAAALATTSPLPKTSPAHVVSAPAPVIADQWFWVPFVSTKNGPRVCPPGVELSNAFTYACKGEVPLMKAHEYFAKACPLATLVNVTPVFVATSQRMMFGYREGSTALPCARPDGASQP